MLYIIKCALLLIFLGESLFLPAFSVCGFRFSEVACEILPSVLGWLHWLLHVLFVGQKKESLQLSICHLSCLYSLWCTCPLIFPGELEILRHPEPVASLISLCFNPNRTGTPLLSPIGLSYLQCLAHCPAPSTRPIPTDQPKVGHRIRAQASLFGACHGTSR